MPVTPNAENTFTIVRRPLKDSERKTLERLMTMQKDVQRGRTKLAERRGRENVVHGRGGRDWVVQAVTKLVHVEIGQTFTIHVSHNILPDLRSVEQYLEVAKAGSSDKNTSCHPPITVQTDLHQRQALAPAWISRSASRSAIGAMGHGKDDGVNQPHAVCSPG